MYALPFAWVDARNVSAKERAECTSRAVDVWA